MEVNIYHETWEVGSMTHSGMGGMGFKSIKEIVMKPMWVQNSKWRFRNAGFCIRFQLLGKLTN